MASVVWLVNINIYINQGWLLVEEFVMQIAAIVQADPMCPKDCKFGFQRDISSACPPQNLFPSLDVSYLLTAASHVDRWQR